MKKYGILILSVVVVLFSALLVYITVKENTYSAVVVSQNFDNRININTANEEELSLLPGINMGKAKNIVNYRKHRKFEKTSDILDVKGIGKSIYEDIRNLITV